VADVERGSPVRPGETLFRIGSVSKALTATALLAMVDQGLASLDTPVGDVLEGIPALEGSEDPVRVHHLLAHTAGFDQTGRGRHAESPATRASRHGSTYEIAEAITNEIQEAGFMAELREINQNPHLPMYDAAIIGSAVYMGRWLSEANKFLEENQDELVNMPVWLFSSGPLGDDLDQIESEQEPYNIEELMVMTRAVGHKIFVGKLDKKQLGLREKLVIRMVKAPTGDFRDWQMIQEWAAEIVGDLSPVPA
jgi:menaquinone-dependent protoporphyrinogen oxidase